MHRNKAVNGKVKAICGSGGGAKRPRRRRKQKWWHDPDKVQSMVLRWSLVCIFIGMVAQILIQHFRLLMT